MNYPTPDENPMCQCKGNPMKAFWCTTGHMLECHYSYDCSTAACNHLHKYDYSPLEIVKLEREAREKSERGDLWPYEFDDLGNARMAKPEGAVDSDPSDTPMASNTHFDPPDLPEEE
jgi:hypothetical protein